MGQVQLEPGVIIEYNDDWSFQIINNVPLTDIPDGITIYASDFSSEFPDFSPFREDMQDVTFIKCNLNNLIIPNSGE